MSGEVQALIDSLLQDAAVDTRERVPGELSERAIPPGWQVVYTDNERLLDHPRRPHGEIKVRSAKGFIDAVKQRWPSGPIPGDDFAATLAEHMTRDLNKPDAEGKADARDVVPMLILKSPVSIYADDATRTLVAILNDDQGSTAGWRDHRVALDVSRSEEWVHWTSGSGKLTSQDTFADAIEKGALEITDPSPAQMLRIAETFQATVGVTFKKGSQVRDGAQQYVYEETIDASAGNGSIAIPESFTIVVAPFIGSPKYEVKAALKTRLRDGKFTIGYTLERPHEVERAAFRDIADNVATALNLTAIEGVAPAPR
jgi:uncharacterized protein YfdQ (DUF2303 family)